MSNPFVYLFRLKANYFTYAGTKDRRAVTTQRMCVKRRKAEDLDQASLWGLKVGNYEYKHKSLRLGDLSGNKFTLTIRYAETYGLYFSIQWFALFLSNSGNSTIFFPSNLKF